MKTKRYFLIFTGTFKYRFTAPQSSILPILANSALFLILHFANFYWFFFSFSENPKIVLKFLNLLIDPPNLNQAEPSLANLKSGSFGFVLDSPLQPTITHKIVFLIVEFFFLIQEKSLRRKKEKKIFFFILRVYCVVRRFISPSFYPISLSVGLTWQHQQTPTKHVSTLLWTARMLLTQEDQDVHQDVQWFLCKEKIVKS